MVFDGFAYATNVQGYDLHKVLRDATPYEVQIIQLSLIYQSHHFFYLIKNKGIARLNKRKYISHLASDRGQNWHSHFVAPAYCLNHLYSPSAKLLLISSRVARIYGFLTSLLRASRRAQFLRVRDGWAQWHVNIHRRKLARSVYSKHWIPSRPQFVCKFVDWSSSVFQLL